MKLSAKQYAARLDQAWLTVKPGEREALLTAFLQLLHQHHALKLVPRVLEHLQALSDQRAGLTRVTIESAAAVDVDDIQSRLHKAFGKIVVESRVNPALVGGLKIKVGDALIDASVSGQLKRLQTHLAQG